MGQAGAAVHASVRLDGYSATQIMARVAEQVEDARADVTTVRLAPDRLQLSRDYRPTWTIVLAVLLFPVGLLFLLVRRTEMCEVRAVDGPTGAAVSISGTLEPSLETLVRDAVVTEATGVPAPTPHIPTPPPAPPTPASGLSMPPPVQGASGTREEVAAVAHAAPPATPPHRDASDHTVVRAAATPFAAPVGPRLEGPNGMTVDLVPGDRVLIGRDPAPAPGTRTLRIDDDARSLSKTHAAIGIDAGRSYVEDLHSTNGTRLVRSTEAAVETVVPGTRIFLDDGDVLRLGTLELRLRER